MIRDKIIEVDIIAIMPACRVIEYQNINQFDKNSFTNLPIVDLPEERHVLTIPVRFSFPIHTSKSDEELFDLATDFAQRSIVYANFISECESKRIEQIRQINPHNSPARVSGFHVDINCHYSSYSKLLKYIETFDRYLVLNYVDYESYCLFS